MCFGAGDFYFFFGLVVLGERLGDDDGLIVIVIGEDCLYTFWKVVGGKGGIGNKGSWWGRKFYLKYFVSFI